MRASLLCLTCLLALATAAVPVAGGETEQPPRPYLAHYSGETHVPQALYESYEELVASLLRGSRRGVERLSLPGSVPISSKSRPGPRRDLGRGVCLPFARSGFDAYVRRVRQESDDTCLLRTGTTWLRFVVTRGGAWRLYDYGDKPIR